MFLLLEQGIILYVLAISLLTIEEMLIEENLGNIEKYKNHP